MCARDTTWPRHLFLTPADVPPVGRIDSVAAPAFADPVGIDRLDRLGFCPTPAAP